MLHVYTYMYMYAHGETHAAFDVRIQYWHRASSLYPG
jgi:hypothetical protein